MRKLLCIFFFSLSFVSCNKKDASSYNIPIQPSLKTAFDYQVGTYWIYRDSISGRVDSFAVKSNKSSHVFVVDHTVDGISINVTEYNAGSRSDTSAWIMNLASNYQELYWWKDLNGIEYADFDPAFTYPFVTGAPGIIGGSHSLNSINVTNVFANYNLNGANYSNVAEIHLWYDNSNNSYDYWLYVNDNAGYVKMRIYDSFNSIDKVWELLRWRIVK